MALRRIPSQVGFPVENRVRTLLDGRHDRDVPKKKTSEPTAAVGVFRWFNPGRRLGVIDAPAVPGGCFVHFSNIVMKGYQALAAGQRVRFTYQRPGFLQDGCPYRALAVWLEP